MTTHTVNIALPDAIYERVRQTARALSRSVQEVLMQSIALALPPLEEDLPPVVRSELAALPLMSDEELWRVTTGSMADAEQTRLEELAEAQKKGPLSSAEESNLTQLMAQAQIIMLSKAEACRILAQRGHRVFPLPAALPG